ncbi:MAG: carbohydrate kinase, partial [Rubrobacter sp.]|nr:carbohydrate kinase [Rubrobacter sp.]
EEASSRGAALLARESLGGPPIEQASVPLGETVEPDERRHEAYMQALERQSALYDALIGG